jgi:hypothetical protein
MGVMLAKVIGFTQQLFSGRNQIFEKQHEERAISDDFVNKNCLAMPALVTTFLFLVHTVKNTTVYRVENFFYNLDYMGIKRR